MLELEIGGVSYLVKAMIMSIFPLFLIGLPLLFLKQKKGINIPIRYSLISIYLISLSILYGMKNYWVSDFESNHLVARGEFCGLNGDAFFYEFCVGEKWYSSNKKGLDMLDDVILNFAWEDLPEGCVEIHYNIKRTNREGKEFVSIGYLKEIEC